MIALVDYGMGNLRSVEKALARGGADVRIVSDRADVLAANALVVPGVGAFGDCMKNLARLKLTDAIREFIATGRPFLGICLGMQGLFESSEEAPGVKGLAVFPGTVPRFHFNGVGAGFTPAEREAGAPVKGAATGVALKVPHMGWNQLRIKRLGCPLLRGVADGSFVYFVHGYYCKPADPAVVCGTTEYGIEFCSMLWSGNVFATQFHPEKSQAIGLKMLENFVRLAEKPGARSQESE
jgi:glutamine amidotransferase